MRDIRIGNDISCRWSIMLKSNGGPYPLPEKGVRLFACTRKGVFEIHDYNIQENTITWYYHGKDQKITGPYRLILYIDHGDRHLRTIDTKAFRLVENSWLESGEGFDGIAVSVSLESSIDISGYIRLDPAVIEFLADGGQKTMSVHSNEDWTLEQQ